MMKRYGSYGNYNMGNSWRTVDNPSHLKVCEHEEHMEEVLLLASFQQELASHTGTNAFEMVDRNYE